MPTYGYRCTACAHEFERFQKMSDEPVRECENCGQPVKRILYPAGIQFKGSGFYVTDYAAKGGGDKGSSKSASGESGSETSESKSDTKTETKTETKSESASATQPATSTSGDKK